jgi:TctA family transporter
MHHRHILGPLAEEHFRRALGIPAGATFVFFTDRFR